ncbi:MAG TPA: T9SS type A sorting domain-containing protein [Candidatus Marinimicrobia bacterium]|nr:T9SS type A sorting domain-containing protein [Candidatus Neomarinimicrobiota bacterium]HRU92860.1 T9SS type A sorting domain-containing protein [Candidatus Neomarinimicrobiota bacterium]
MKAKKLILSNLFLFFLLMNVSEAQWTRIEGLYGGKIRDIIVDKPRMYAMANNYLYRSDNMGLTWENTCFDVSKCGGIMVNDSNVFAWRIIVTGNDGYLAHSSDYGKTWEELHGILDSVGVRSINMKNSKLYVGTSSAGLFTSDDNGSTWSRCDNLPDCWLILKIFFTDSSIFLVTGDGVFRSSDEGLSWDYLTNISGYVTCIAFNGESLLIQSGSEFYISQDNGDSWTMLPHSYVIDSYSDASKIIYLDSTIYYSNPLLYCSLDNGNNWERIDLPTTRPGDNTVWDMAYDSTYIYFATDEGIFYTEIHSNTFNSVSVNGITERGVGYIEFCGENIITSHGKVSGSTYYDPNIYSERDNLWYPMTVDSLNYISTFTTINDSVIIVSTGNVFISNADGLIWNKVCSDIKIKDIKSLGTDLFAIVDTLSNQFFNNIFRSRDMGRTWEGLSLDENYGTYKDIIIDEQNIYILKSIDNRIKIIFSKDAGKTWDSCYGVSSIINSVATIDTVIYIGTKSDSSSRNGLFKSTDGCQTWENIFSEESVISVAKKDKNLIFATSQKIYKIDCTNSEIEEISPGCMGSIYQLKIHNSYLYAGTSTGLWRRPLKDFIVKNIEDSHRIISSYNLSQNYPNPFNPITTITYQIPEESNVCLRIYDILGREVLLLADEVKQVGRYSSTFDGSELPSGVYFARLDAQPLKGKAFSKTIKMVLVK